MTEKKIKKTYTHITTGKIHNFQNAEPKYEMARRPNQTTTTTQEINLGTLKCNVLQYRKTDFTDFDFNPKNGNMKTNNNEPETDSCCFHTNFPVLGYSNFPVLGYYI